MYNFRSSLHQDVPHGFNELRPIIKTAFICNDSTRVVDIMWSSCTKSNSGININAVICIVGDKTDPCLGSLKLPISCQWVKIEPLSVTVNLRGGLLDQSRTSIMCHVPVTCFGIAHQRSLSTESQPACG